MSIINNRKNSAVGVKETYVALLTGALLLDVREIEEFEAGHVQGAINIPLSELNERYIELDKNDEIHIIVKVEAVQLKQPNFWLVLVIM